MSSPSTASSSPLSPLSDSDDEGDVLISQSPPPELSPDKPSGSAPPVFLNRRFIVAPSEIVRRNHDNIEDHLVVREADMLKCGRYYLYHLLGSGEYSNVFVAFDQGDRGDGDGPVSVYESESRPDRLVAVKIVRARPGYIVSAQREIEALRRLCLPPDSPDAIVKYSPGSDVFGRADFLLEEEDPRLGLVPSDVFVESPIEPFSPLASPFPRDEEIEFVVSPGSRPRRPGRRERRGLEDWAPGDFMTELVMSSLEPRTDRYHFKPDCGAVELLDACACCNHACLVFPLLESSLDSWLSATRFQGLPISQVRVITRQILDCLVEMHDRNLIHTDIKPDNVLFKNSVPLNENDEAVLERELVVRVIDFGSTEFLPELDHLLLQTLWYRAPEVILAKPRIDAAIDMWSLGCLVAELFLGLPIFEGDSHYPVLSQIVTRIGPPPLYLRSWLNFGEFFKVDHPSELVQFKTPGEFLFQLAQKDPQAAKPNLTHPVRWAVSHLHDLILQCGGLSGTGMMLPEDLDRRSSFVAKPPSLSSEETQDRRCLLDFLARLLVWDPIDRMSANEALQHAFLRPFSSE